MKNLSILNKEFIYIFTNGSYGSKFQCNLNSLEKIDSIMDRAGTIQFHLDNKYIDDFIVYGNEGDLIDEIKYIKDKLIDLGISKELIDKYSNDFEIYFSKIKTELKELV